MGEITGDSFTFFSFTLEDARRAYMVMTKELVADRGICICGHPSRHHRNIEGQETCISKNLFCPCNYLLTVIECEDLRFFAKVTRGEGANHALSLGIASSHFRGKWVKWRGEPVCMNCKKTGVRTRPVPVDKHGIKKKGPAAVNVLACLECLP